eukprot:gb/GEZJ01010709.1/.p2 GENE.gb/GEZJ01010709.1/~~gb/GEZJ01010709.1/.p2  ORF type:complete len:131 (-),score=3.50 gb/GEZJ01010709.1/:101-493(-)
MRHIKCCTLHKVWQRLPRPSEAFLSPCAQATVSTTDMSSGNTKKNGTATATSSPAEKGKNMQWNETETLALVCAAFTVSTDPEVGSIMSGAEHGRRIRVVFIKDSGNPGISRILPRTGCKLEKRRWEGRS